MALEQTGNRENVVQLVETQEPIVLLNRRFASFPRVESGEEWWRSARFFHGTTLLEGDRAIPILGKAESFSFENSSIFNTDNLTRKDIY